VPPDRPLADEAPRPQRRRADCGNGPVYCRKTARARTKEPCEVHWPASSRDDARNASPLAGKYWLRSRSI
jgi:hypothetical protein